MYPFGESAAHLTGYLRSMYKEELEKYEEKGYSSSEQIGAAGLEQVFEEELHGTTGWIIKVKGTDEVIAKKKLRTETIFTLQLMLIFSKIFTKNYQLIQVQVSQSIQKPEKLWLWSVRRPMIRTIF